MIATTTTTPARAASERRLLVGAFLSLFGILAAQSLLETARDALFLTHLPIARLPWLYLAMAALAVLVSQVSRVVRLLPPWVRGGRAAALTISLAIGAVVTAALTVPLARSSVFAIYALVLWSGIFSAHAVTQVWTVLGESLDMSLAKRLYGRLAAGGGLGAVAGAAAARLLSHQLEPRHLVLLAAAIAAVTALGPAWALRRTPGAEAAPARRVTSDRRRRARIVEHPYVTRLLLAAMLAAAVSTLIDFSFKEAVAAHLPAERLSAFFATFYLVTSALGLVLQLFGVAWLVRAAGVGRAPLVLPLLLLAGVVWTILTGGLGAVLVLRGLDSALRGALHRPALELLQVPLDQRIRRRVKPVIDAVGQRGGQALAALVSLLLFHLVAAPGMRMLLAGVLLLFWAAVALDLARRYVDLLRATLVVPGLPVHQAVTFGLDGVARQTLVAALDSGREAQVLAALGLLTATQQQGLIPLRLLDHEAPGVVRRVIQALTSDVDGNKLAFAAEPIRRGALVAALDRLLRHPSVCVRTAALRGRTALAPDRGALTALARDASCPAVRGVALVALIARGWIDPTAGSAALDRLVVQSAPAVRLAVAEAIADRPSPHFQSALHELARQGHRRDGEREAEAAGLAATALGGLGGADAIATLVALLGRREVRDAARAALARLGGGAFDAVATALSDGEQPLGVRANAPRALVEIDPDRAPHVLLDGLLIEEDGFIRYRILRALNRIRRVRPGTTLDEDILGRAAVSAVESAYRYLAWRLSLEDGLMRLPGRRTATWELLHDLLREKEDNAIERLFRVLALRYPREDFRRLLRTLRAGGRRTRAAGRELIDNLLSGPAHALTLALVDDVGDRERLVALSMFAGPPSRAPIYRDLLAEIRAQEASGTLAALAAHHAAELVTAAAGEGMMMPAAPRMVHA